MEDESFSFFVSINEFLDPLLDTTEFSRGVAVEGRLGCFGSINKLLDPLLDTTEFSRAAVEGRLGGFSSGKLPGTGEIFRTPVVGRLDPFVSSVIFVLLQAS